MAVSCKTYLLQSRGRSWSGIGWRRHSLESSGYKTNHRRNIFGRTAHYPNMDMISYRHLDSCRGRTLPIEHRCAVPVFESPAVPGREFLEEELDQS